MGRTSPGENSIQAAASCVHFGIHLRPNSNVDTTDQGVEEEKSSNLNLLSLVKLSPLEILYLALLGFAVVLVNLCVFRSFGFCCYPCELVCVYVCFYYHL